MTMTRRKVEQDSETIYGQVRVAEPQLILNAWRLERGEMISLPNYLAIFLKPNCAEIQPERFGCHTSISAVIRRFWSLRFRFS